MMEYKYLSEQEIREKAAKINAGRRIKPDTEYIAMKNELNNITSIKNSYIIVLFTGLIAFWVCVLTGKESVIPEVPYILLLPQFFIYVIQDKINALTDLHIRIQAQIWTIYDSFYESNYISIVKKFYGPRNQTVFSRIRKIPALYMGVANGLIIVILACSVFGTKENSYIHWVITLVSVVVIQVIITIKFWNSRNGDVRLISYAEQLLCFTEVEKEIVNDNNGQ